VCVCEGESERERQSCRVRGCIVLQLVLFVGLYHNVLIYRSSSWVCRVDVGLFLRFPCTCIVSI